MKENRLMKSFRIYIERLQDLLNNPRYEAFSNEELEPLILRNEEVFVVALLKDESDVVEALKDEEVFISLADFFVLIQKHFKSKRISNQLDESFKLIEHGSTYAEYSKEYIEYIANRIAQSKKVIE